MTIESTLVLAPSPGGPRGSGSFVHRRCTSAISRNGMLTEPDSYGDYEGVCCAHIGRLIATQRPPHPHRTIAQHVGECFPSFACDRLGAVLDPVVVSLLPCRRRHEATARYAYDLPCSRCGAPLAARLSRSAASTRARRWLLSEQVSSSITVFIGYDRVKYSAPLFVQSGGEQALGQRGLTGGVSVCYPVGGGIESEHE